LQIDRAKNALIGRERQAVAHDLDGPDTQRVFKDDFDFHSGKRFSFFLAVAGKYETKNQKKQTGSHGHKVFQKVKES
jgi:hypothetical protein